MGRAIRGRRYVFRRQDVSRRPNGGWQTCKGSDVWGQAVYLSTRNRCDWPE